MLATHATLQGGEWAGRFATQDVVYALVQIITAGKSEGLKSTAASTLSRLMRATSPLVGHVVDKFGVRLFLSGLSDSSSKVGARCCCLAFALCTPAAQAAACWLKPHYGNGTSHRSGPLSYSSGSTLCSCPCTTLKCYGADATFLVLNIPRRRPPALSASRSSWRASTC